MRDRIRPPAELEATVLDRLRDDKLIETKQKGMMLAAAIGYHLAGSLGDGRELDKAGEGIRLEYFERARDDGFIDALAVTKFSDLHLLETGRLEARIELFERFAYLGLKELQRVCYSGHEKPLDALLALIDRVMASADNGDLPGLDDLAGFEGLLE